MCDQNIEISFKFYNHGMLDFYKLFHKLRCLLLLVLLEVVSHIGNVHMRVGWCWVTGFEAVAARLDLLFVDACRESGAVFSFGNVYRFVR